MIAITPDYTGSIKIKEWLTKNGFDCFVLEKERKIPWPIDGIVFSGGADIGKRPERDELEFYWFEQLYKKVPILGICRGMQLINVALGGTLIEDITESDKVDGSINHGTLLKEGSTLCSLEEHAVYTSGYLRFTVNSKHHQAIDKLGIGLEVIGSTTDGVTEIISNDYVLGVQWHPEFPCTYSSMICEEFPLKIFDKKYEEKFRH
jgi:gamma-glutamyl-gamma-aminobutyrate hydrolase PuuD